MPHLSLVPPRRSTTPVVRNDLAEQPVAYVPVRLLLAASGRCSCDECCRAAVSTASTVPQPVRAARRTDRQPVRNRHRLS